MRKLYWVGTRESDIEDTMGLFNGSITIFGSNSNGNISYCTDNIRINHNISNKECDQFFIETLEGLCEKDKDVQFVFYNPAIAYQYSEIIQLHTLCLNSLSILDTLSNKYRSRLILKNIVDTVPYIVLKGSECSYDNLCNCFSGYDEFIIQKAISAGGEGTFHINKHTYNNFIDADEEYLVSPYIKDSISVNTHVVISDKQILHFPSSVQIITEIENKLLYCGADFICYRTLPVNLSSNIEKTVKKIGEFVQKKGYRGILGIDFIVKDEQIYFMEFNTRFQASSHLINKALHENGQPTLQKMNLMAFSSETIEVDPFEVNYSSYIYTTGNISKERLKKIINSKEISHIHVDGFNVTKNIYPKEKNIYLNRCIFSRNICALNNGKMILHPNIYVEDIKSLLYAENPHYKEHIKISLLNHGVNLSDSALKLAMNYGKIKEAVFDAIDIIIFNKVYVNVPCSCKFNTFSPFTIENEDDKFILQFDGKNISNVEIYFVPDELLNKYTKSGVPYDSIINLATDRIRINPAPVCYYKHQGLQCKFCNLPNDNIPYDITDIKEVIDYCLTNVKFEHFLIGGGTYSIDEDGWNIIEDITQYIRKKCNKNIYLMSIPPKDNSFLDRLKESGITEVAFNLEMFNRNLAKHHMPGKGIISEKQYMSALSHSVSLWGNTGNVRSLLIYGFDTNYDFLEGIEKLCKLGVEPIISIFRPLNNTEFSELNPPPTLDIIAIYNNCQRLVKNYSMILGPDCPMCQNNTLSFTELT